MSFNLLYSSRASCYKEQSMRAVIKDQMFKGFILDEVLKGSPRKII